MRYSYKDIYLIAGSLGKLYRSGIHIQKSMELIEELSISKRYKESIVNIKELLNKGEGISGSFRKHNKIYPNFYIEFMGLGEESGELESTLISLERFYKSQYKIRKSIISASIYPLFLIIFGILLSIILFFYIIPTFYDSFYSISKSIPPIISTCYNTKKYITNNPFLGGVYLICWIIMPLIIFIVYIIKKEIIKKVFYKFKIGKRYKEYMVILTFSIIFNSGATLLRGINICLKSENSIIDNKELKRIEKELLEGIELSKVLDENTSLSKNSRALISLGEQSGNLISLFTEIEEELRIDLDKQINNILKLIQPILVLFIGLIIVLFATTFISPIFEMMNFT